MDSWGSNDASTDAYVERSLRGRLVKAEKEIERLRTENGNLRECAWALWNVMDGLQDHHIQDETALSDAECERIAKARAFAIRALEDE